MEGEGASRGAGIPEVNRVVPSTNALVQRRSLTSFVSSSHVVVVSIISEKYKKP